MNYINLIEAACNLDKKLDNINLFCLYTGNTIWSTEDRVQQIQNWFKIAKTNNQNPEHVMEIESDQEIMDGHENDDNQESTDNIQEVEPTDNIQEVEPTDNTHRPTDNAQEPTDNSQEPTDNIQEPPVTDNAETSVNDHENDLLLLATSDSVMITVSTTDDDNMDSDESDFEYEQLEEMNHFFISKYAAEQYNLICYTLITLSPCILF